MQRSTSSARPISGSTSPCEAFAFRSTQYLAKAESSLPCRSSVWDCSASAPLTGRDSENEGFFATPCAMKFTAS